MTTVRQLPETKQQIEIFAQQLEQGLESGTIVASELLRFQKALDKVFEKIKPVLIECALNEIGSYEKNPIIKNTEFSIVEAGTKYDYSGCNDPIYNSNLGVLEIAKESIKERENFLKCLKQPMTFVNDETGEIVTLNPPKKSSTTTVKVTFK